jgi:hypothetical protein
MRRKGPAERQHMQHKGADTTKSAILREGGRYREGGEKGGRDEELS